jgi:uncharacterized protein YndB with AHSA1/START domain
MVYNGCLTAREKNFKAIMASEDTTVITVQAVINAPINMVWNCWTNPEDIVHWNHASDDWHTPNALNDLKPGGKFVYRMEAKDDAVGFYFSGTYKAIIPNKYLEYLLDDGRSVKIVFIDHGIYTEITETFEAETTNPVEMQRQGWQAIINSFKKYVEAK